MIKNDISGVIYKITNLKNNKIYIGKTIDFEKKVKKYKRELKNELGRLIIKSMKKHGFDNFNFEILDNVFSIKNLNEKEIYFIRKFDSANNIIGYNMTNGGDGEDTMSNNVNKKSIYKKKK